MKPTQRHCNVGSNFRMVSRFKNRTTHGITVADALTLFARKEKDYVC